MFLACHAHHQEKQIVSINTLKKICASRWSFTKNHYMMHGQQNVKFWIKKSSFIFP